MKNWLLIILAIGFFYQPSFGHFHDSTDGLSWNNDFHGDSQIPQSSDSKEENDECESEIEIEDDFVPPSSNPPVFISKNLTIKERVADYTAPFLDQQFRPPQI